MELKGDVNPHDVACLLKEYLRSLPEPLIIRELYSYFIMTRREHTHTHATHTPHAHIHTTRMHTHTPHIHTYTHTHTHTHTRVFIAQNGINN